MRADTWLILAVGAVVGFVGYRLVVDRWRAANSSAAAPTRAALLVASVLFGSCALLAWLNLQWR